MKTFLILALSFFLSPIVKASDITGLVVDDSNVSIPFVRCWLIDGDSTCRLIRGDLDGKFKFTNVPAGIYDMRVSAFGSDSLLIKHIILKEDNVLHLGTLTLHSLNYWRGCCGCPHYPDPIQIDNDLADAQKSIIISKDDIQMIPSRSPREIVDIVADVVVVESEEIEVVRGSRPNDLTYFLDGVKCLNEPTIPLAAYEKVTVFTGGIPAKYGDTTGGIMVITTLGYFDLYYGR
ncbi:MAG: hypothetical protein ACI857_003329 [Arenicella sp.]|jgi:hypothetical protein